MSGHKVIIIGIDGGTFDVIRPMVDRGELPILASLMKEGVWGELQSTIPPDTAPAWVSMMTGVNPGKHGIFFFLDNLHNNYLYGRTLGSKDIRFPPLWSILDKNNKKVLFINVPFTYPAMEVRGVVISGMLVPHNAEVVSYPANVYPDMVKRLGRYEIDDWSLAKSGADGSRIHLYYDKIIEGISLVTEHRKKAALILLEEMDWDFSMVVFTSIDRLQHLFWKFMDPEDNDYNHDLLSKYGKVICNGYKQVDSAIGEILEKAGRDTTVIISSDHGFGPLRKHFFVNKWLEEIGLLKVKKGVSHKKVNLAASNLHRILTRVVPGVSLPDWTERISVPIPRIADRDMDEMIDWQNTRAYSNQCGINVNLLGREPHGIVGYGKEFEDLLTFIQKEFYQLRDESKPEGMIADWIVRKEDIYTGPFVQKAIDLYFSVNNRTYLQNTGINGDGKFRRSSLGSGMHRMNGMFIMNSPFCCKGKSIKPRIIDITPTILYLMGLPILEGIDGRILREAIDPDHLKSHPIKRIQSWECHEEGSMHSATDEEKIREGLKSLGYL